MNESSFPFPHLCRGKRNVIFFALSVNGVSNVKNKGSCQSKWESWRKLKILKEGRESPLRALRSGYDCTVCPSAAPNWGPKPGFPSAPEMGRKSTKRPICGRKRRHDRRQPTTLSGEAERA